MILSNREAAEDLSLESYSAGQEATQTRESLTVLIVLYLLS